MYTFRECALSCLHNRNSPSLSIVLNTCTIYNETQVQSGFQNEMTTNLNFSPLHPEKLKYTHTSSLVDDVATNRGDCNRALSPCTPLRESTYKNGAEKELQFILSPRVSMLAAAPCVSCTTTMTPYPAA